MQTKIIDNPVKRSSNGFGKFDVYLQSIKSKHDFRQLITLMPTAAAL